MDETLRGRLATIVAMLNRAWLEALHVQDGRDFWHELAPLLKGHSGVLLRQWYVAWLLMACRRLLDIDRDVDSLVRALVLLEKVAPQVTADVVVTAWQDADTHHRPDEIEEDARAAVARLASNGRQLTRADVRADRERLEKAHRKVLTYASQSVAHRPTTRTVDGVSEEEVEALLDDVVAVARRWHVLTHGSDLSTHRPGVRGSDLLTALRVFDYGDYLDAVQEQRRRIGPFAPREAYENFEEDVRVRFEWPGSSPS